VFEGGVEKCLEKKRKLLAFKATQKNPICYRLNFYYASLFKTSIRLASIKMNSSLHTLAFAMNETSPPVSFNFPAADSKQDVEMTPEPSALGPALPPSNRLFCLFEAVTQERNKFLQEAGLVRIIWEKI
jgi:hypothetical protein